MMEGYLRFLYAFFFKFVLVSCQHLRTASCDCLYALPVQVLHYYGTTADLANAKDMERDITTTTKQGVGYLCLAH